MSVPIDLKFFWIIVLVLASCGEDSSDSVGSESSEFTRSTRDYSEGDYTPNSSTGSSPIQTTTKETRYDLVDCYAYSYSYYYYSSDTRECINLALDIQVGSQNQSVVVQGKEIAFSDFNKNISQLIKSARFESGDRDWNDDIPTPSTTMSSVVIQNSLAVSKLDGVTNTSRFSLSVSNLKLNINRPDAVANIFIESVSGAYCVKFASESKTISKASTQKVSLRFESLTGQVLKNDCKTPIDNFGGVANILATISPSATKLEVSTIMGTSGLQVTSSTLWTWSGSGRSAGCIANASSCTVLFDASGKVVSTKGIKATYLNLSNW